MKSGAATDDRTVWKKLFTGDTWSGRWLKRFLVVGVAITMVSCSSSQQMEDTTTRDPAERMPPPASPPSLASTNWKVTEVDGVAVTDPVQPTLVFDSAGQVSGETACNRYSGTVVLAGNSLRFAPLVSERIACSDTTRLANERQFLNDMQGVKTYELDGDGQLRLLDASGSTVVRLSRVP